MTVHYRHLQI